MFQLAHFDVQMCVYIHIHICKTPSYVYNTYIMSEKYKTYIMDCDDNVLKLEQKFQNTR